MRGRYGTGGGQYGVRVALTVAGLAVVAAACSSSGGGVKPIGAGGPPPTVTTSAPTSSSTAAAATTTTLDATRTAIVFGYRQAETAFLAVAGHYPVVPTDPRLPQHMTGDELRTVRSRLTAAALAGQYASGNVELAPVVTAVDGTTATINDCLFDHAVIVDGRTQQPVTKASTERTLQKVTMALEDGTWKISDDQPQGAGCVPAA